MRDTTLVVGCAVVLEENLHIALGQHEQRFRSTEGVLAVLRLLIRRSTTFAELIVSFLYCTLFRLRYILSLQSALRAGPVLCRCLLRLDVGA